MTYTYAISGDDYGSAGAASSDIKKKLRQLGLPSPLIKRTAIAMYEAEINMVIHGGGGTTRVDIGPDCIEMEFHDQGPGIADIELAMTEGWSTASDAARELGFGAGMGLPNIRRNVDELSIESVPGQGTTVRMSQHLGGRED
ncbi:MAG: ATP-binding protein [Spirochaetales bacterium]|nr:ATP-binding protein [Spirochaetales bacterium]